MAPEDSGELFNPQLISKLAGEPSPKLIKRISDAVVNAMEGRGEDVRGE